MFSNQICIFTLIVATINHLEKAAHKKRNLVIEKNVKDPLALTVMHCALFILIRPDGPRSFERKNYSLSSQEAALSHIKSPSNTFANFVLGRSSRLRVAVAEDIFFASKNPIQKKNNDVKDAGKLFLLSPNV